MQTWGRREIPSKTVPRRHCSPAITSVIASAHRFISEIFSLGNVRDSKGLHRKLQNSEFLRAILGKIRPTLDSCRRWSKLDDEEERRLPKRLQNVFNSNSKQYDPEDLPSQATRQCFRYEAGQFCPLYDRRKFVWRRRLHLQVLLTVVNHPVLNTNTITSRKEVSSSQQFLPGFARQPHLAPEGPVYNSSC